MTLKNLKSKVPLLLLEKMVLGELSAPEKGRLDKDLSSEDKASVEKDISDSNAEIFRQFPVKEFSSQVNHRLLQEKAALKRRTVAISAVTSLALAACLTLVLFNQGFFESPAAPDQDILLKGQEAHVLVYRKLESSYERLQPEALGHTGDILQVRYIAAGHRYGAIFSIDGRGKVTWHYPANPGESFELKSSGEIALPYAYQLDDAPHFERFFLVAASDVFSISDLSQQAQKLAEKGHVKDANLELPKGMVQFSILIRKPAHE